MGKAIFSLFCGNCPPAIGTKEPPPKAEGWKSSTLYARNLQSWTTKWSKIGGSMKEYQTLSHSIWECKYHVVFVPKYRQKRLYGDIRRELGDMFHKLSHQKECRIVEGHLMPDHVHMLISVPPKYSVAHIVGFLKGKTALYMAQNHGRRRKHRGYHF